MKKIWLSLLLALFSCAPPAMAAQQSTINMVIPVPGTPVTAGPINQNFIRAANDINNLYSLIGAPGGTAGAPGGTIGQLQYKASSTGFGGFTMNGDCTITATTGAIVCTKINGQSLGTAAFLNTGTSGGTIPLLNGTNSWSGQQSFSGVTFSNITGGTQCLQVNALGVVSGTSQACGTGGGGGGSVSSIATNNGITGGTITSTGTIGLATTANNTALCNNTGTTNAPTAANCTVSGTGNLVLATSPTLATPQVTGNLNLSSGSQYRINGTQIAATNLSNGTTGTGAIMLAGSPTTTGTLTGAAATFSSPVAIGTTTQSTGTALDMGSTTGAVLLPVGTVAQRPSTPKPGEIRYNSSIPGLEAYINAAWNQITVGGPFGVNVMSWPYSAKCDGTTDDTATIEAAAVPGLPVFIPPTTAGCAVNGLVPPSDSFWVGTASPQYTGNPSGPWSHVVPTAAATAVWNLNNAFGITIESLDTLGSPSLNFSSNMVCFNAGNTSTVQFLFASVRFCGNGGIGDAGDYPNSVLSFGTNWIANGQNTSGSGGLVNIVDSQVDGGFITSNRNGVSFGPGANNNVITSTTRLEFNEFYGVLCNGATKELIDGTYDRNGSAAINFVNCGSSTGQSGNGSGVDGTGVDDGVNVYGIYTRNGNGATAGNEAHFEFNGGNTNITFNGISTSHDCGDGGCSAEGPNSPKYVAEFADSTDVGIRFVGGNLNGYTTAFQNNITGTGPGDYGIIGAVGAENVTPYTSTFNGAVTINAVPTPAAPTITTFGTAGAATWTYKIVAVLGNGTTTAASTAGSTTSGNATLSAANYNVISWPYVAGAYQYKIYRTAHGTSPTTLGLIATVPSTNGLAVLANINSFGGGGQFWDTGLVGDTTTAPSVNTTGSLTLSAISGSTQCLQANSSGVVSGTGSACGSGGGGGTVTLGTSASATNPQRSSEASTGLYSLNSGEVDVGVVTTGAIAKFTSAGENVVAGAYQIGGNNALGFNTADSTTAGSIAIGKGVMSGQTSSAAYGNVGVGYQVLNGTMTTAAINNVGLGFEALQVVTSGNGNLGLGSFAGQGLTTGVQNVFIGTNAGVSTASGQQNVAIGGNNSTAFATLGANISGGNNMAIGVFALGHTTGSNNTAIGVSTGAAVVAGNNNTEIGYQVGQSNGGSGSNNVLIGAGGNVDVPTGTTSNYLNIDNLLAGDATNASSTPGGATAQTLYLASTSSGVDYITITPGATGSPGVATIAATGTDTNISMKLSAKGTGIVNLPTAAVTVQTPTISTATFTPVMNTGQDFIIGLTSACPCTLANPTAPTAGQHGLIYVVQDGTGSRTIGTWGSEYLISGGTSAITLSTGASAIDVFSYAVKDSTHIVLSGPQTNVVH